MDEIIANALARLVEGQAQKLGVAGLKWSAYALPDWLLPAIIFPALVAWVVVALRRRWRSRLDSNQRPSV